MRLIILLILLPSCSNIFIPNDDNFSSIHLNGGAWIQIEDQYDCENGLRVVNDEFLIEIFFSGDLNPTNNAGTIFSFTGKKSENFDDINCNEEWDYNEEYDDEPNGEYDEGCDQFIDSNNNLEWDDAELFTDSDNNGNWDDAEEFVDTNENEQWDNTESFSDVNGNGEWDDAEEFVDSNGDEMYTEAEEYIDFGNCIFDLVNDNSFIVLAVSENPSNSNMLSFYINDNREEVEISGADFTNPNEFHLLQVFSDDSTIYFYLDDILAYSKKDGIMIQDASFLVGAIDIDKNLWYGYIDEIRLWDSQLTDETRSMHYENPDKLVISMQDELICNLRGLWNFNYSSPTSNIPDEKCIQINYHNENICEYQACESYLLDGTLYTTSGSNANFSTFGF